MKRFSIKDLYWVGLLALVTLFFAAPATHQTFVSLTASHPYLMGFLKFAILATLGELLALRLASGAWKRPAGLFIKMFIWGLFGVGITFMFSFFSAGVSALLENGQLPAAPGFAGALLKAFLISLIMNLTFGPVFMAVHRVSDTWIELASQGKKPSGREVLAAVTWADFVGFVVCKTIPLWWIPAHTVTFLLPGEYLVLAAAYLSIVLGVILVYARSRKGRKVEMGTAQ